MFPTFLHFEKEELKGGKAFHAVSTTKNVLKEKIEYNICMCTKYNNDCRKKQIVDKEIKKVQQDKLILPCDQIIKNRGATQKI